MYYQIDRKQAYNVCQYFGSRNHQNDEICKLEALYYMRYYNSRPRLTFVISSLVSGGNSFSDIKSITGISFGDFCV